MFGPGPLSTRRKKTAHPGMRQAEQPPPKRARRTAPPTAPPVRLPSIGTVLGPTLLSQHQDQDQRRRRLREKQHSRQDILDQQLRERFRHHQQEQLKQHRERAQTRAREWDDRQRALQENPNKENLETHPPPSMSTNSETTTTTTSPHETLNNNEGLDNECGICLDTIIERGELNCCDHLFCFVCIFKWYVKSCSLRALAFFDLFISFRFLSPTEFMNSFLPFPLLFFSFFYVPNRIQINAFSS